ncbi:MAG: hypothetical protein AB7V46_10575 [Thermomicrobiales bacterium]
MCLDCGCGKPNDDHGNPDHLTMRHIEKAAEASEISVDEAANNIIAALKEDRSSTPQASA